MDPGTIIAIAQITGQALISLKSLAEEFHDAPESLALVTAETNNLNLQLERFAVIQKDFPPHIQAYLDQQVSTEQCKQTVRKLEDRALKVQPSSKMNLIGRMKWLWNKYDVEELVTSLRRETDRLAKLLTPEQLNQLLGITTQVLGKSDEINEKIETLMQLVSSLKLSQPPPIPIAPSFDSNGLFSPYQTTGIAWYGQWRLKPGQNFSITYFKDRKRLAEAAWLGNWETVKSALRNAESQHRQRWINTTRIHDVDASMEELSGFTALHQAAHHGSKSTVEWLIKHGAWRSLRTYRASSKYLKYSTPLDVARGLGWEHLYEPLSPIIRRTISPKILQRLQDRLHDLIRVEFGKEPDVHLDCFILPELEILMEFDRSRLWFPLNPELLDTRQGLAIHIVLDRHELVVVFRWGKERRRNFRISEEGVQEIQKAVILS